MYAVTVVFYIDTKDESTAKFVVDNAIKSEHLDQPDESYQIVQAEEINEPPQEG
jgi:hypothetical protein